MTDLEKTYLKWTLIGVVSLPLSGVAYAMGFWIGGEHALLFSLAFPPLLLISCLAIAYFLARGRLTPILRVAVFSAALAAATFLIMITIQSSLQSSLLPEYRALEEGAERVAALWSLKVMDQTQLAIDVAWDVWISLATVAFGIGMMSATSQTIERILGVIGTVAGTAGLTINFYTFPRPPRDEGLPDPGIFFFVWFSLMAIYIILTVLGGRKAIFAGLEG